MSTSDSQSGDKKDQGKTQSVPQQRKAGSAQIFSRQEELQAAKGASGGGR